MSVQCKCFKNHEAINDLTQLCNVAGEGSQSTMMGKTILAWPCFMLSFIDMHWCAYYSLPLEMRGLKVIIKSRALQTDKQGYWLPSQLLAVLERWGNFKNQTGSTPRRWMLSLVPWQLPLNKACLNISHQTPSWSKTNQPF